MYRFDGKSFFPHKLKSRYESTGSWPESGVDVTDETWKEFVANAPEGKMLGAENNGAPCWVNLPAPSHDEKCAMARQRRDSDVSSSMWIAERHRGQVQLNIETSISSGQYDQLLTYHQSLRDWPAQPGWPDIDMPPAPDWLAELKK